MADYDFVLCHLLEDKRYREFFEAQGKAGRYMILDNSAFELGKPMDTEILLDRGSRLGANCIIAPDALKDYKNTLKLTEDFIGKLSNYNFEVGACVQGSNFKEWMACYLAFLDMPIDKMCLTFAIDFEVPGEQKMSSPTMQRVERRVKLIEHIHSLGLVDESRTYHLLGVSDCIEYERLRKFDFIDSADTSSPIVHGMNYIYYTSKGLPGEKIREKLDFTKTFNEAQIGFINKNIEMVRSFAQ